MPRDKDLPFHPLKLESTIGDLMDAIEFNVRTRLYVSFPGTVTAWNPSKPNSAPNDPPRPATVNVRSDFKQVRAIDNEDEVRTGKGETLLRQSQGLYAVRALPSIPRVPYLCVGDPAFNIRGPITVGTTGLCVVADRCLDQWLNEGGPLDPATNDKHDFNDCFFIPTFYHGRNTPTIPADKHQLGPDDGSAGFELNTGTDKSLRVFTDGPTATVDAATNVDLGTSPTRGAARLNDQITSSAALNTFQAQVIAALNTIAAAVPVVIVPPIATTDVGTITTASTKVRAE